MMVDVLVLFRVAICLLSVVVLVRDKLIAFESVSSNMFSLQVVAPLIAVTTTVATGGLRTVRM